MCASFFFKSEILFYFLKFFKADIWEKLCYEGNSQGEHANALLKPDEAEHYATLAWSR